jgi:glutaredoxin
MSLKITLYHMNGCGACVALKPIWAKIKEELKDVKFDEIEQSKIIRNDIQAFPTIIIEKDGEEVEAVVGLRKFDDLMETINKHKNSQSGGKRKARKSKKTSRKTPKKSSRKSSRKLSRKTSKKTSRRYRKK